MISRNEAERYLSNYVDRHLQQYSCGIQYLGSNDFDYIFSVELLIDGKLQDFECYLVSKSDGSIRTMIHELEDRYL